MYSPPYVSKIFCAVLLSPLQPKRSIFVQIQTVLSQNESKHDRTVSVINLIDSVIPGIANRLARWMYRNNRFPWAPVDFELTAFGTGAAVFKLHTKSGDKALRMYRKSLGKSSGELLEMAEYYKMNYEMVLSWYGGSPDLMLPMEFLVLQGLPLVGPVAASLQPYIKGKRYDPFEDFSDEQFLRLLEANDFVRKQFIFFAEQTIRQWDGREMCYDFLGRENLMLVNEAGNYKLRIVDVGIFRFDMLENGYSKKMALIEQRMIRLVSLYELAKEI